MAIFKLPLSGNVSQNINPMNWFSSLTDGQFGMININMGRSSAPEVEQEILDSVGTYGRQLGKLSDAVRVLMRHLPKDTKLNEEEQKALESFQRMVADIDEVKESVRKRYCCSVIKKDGD